MKKTQEALEKVYVLHEKGVSVSLLSKQYGVSVPTTYQWIKQAKNMKIRKTSLHKMPVEVITQILKLSQDGVKTQEISKQTGVSNFIIHNIISLDKNVVLKNTSKEKVTLENSKTTELQESKPLDYRVIYPNGTHTLVSYDIVMLNGNKRVKLTYADGSYKYSTSMVQKIGKLNDEIEKNGRLFLARNNPEYLTGRDLRYYKKVKKYYALLNRDFIKNMKFFRVTKTSPEIKEIRKSYYDLIHYDTYIRLSLSEIERKIALLEQYYRNEELKNSIMYDYEIFKKYQNLG